MKILGIESAQSTVSVSICEDRAVIGELSINGTKDHSQTLLPTLKVLTERMGFDLNELDAIAISGGPGSFTGLRIGSATAKGLAMSYGIPMVHVPTPELMAYGIYGTDAIICPMMDARNKRVFTGLYEFKDEFKVIEPAFAMAVTELAEKLNEMGREVIFTGDGTKMAAPILKETLKVPYSIAPGHLNFPRASAAAIRAFDYVEAGDTVSFADETPDYLRASQAEQEFEKRTGMTVEEAAARARVTKA